MRLQDFRCREENSEDCSNSKKFRIILTFNRAVEMEVCCVLNVLEPSPLQFLREHESNHRAPVRPHRGGRAESEAADLRHRGDALPF